MRTLVPYPIPQPERALLIKAGQDACALAPTKNDGMAPGSPAHKAAQAIVHKIVADIQFKYGIEEQDHEQ